MAWPQFWILFFSHISVTNEDICVKFGRMIDMGHTVATVTKNPTSGKKMAAAAILKIHK